jgi:hypothetical protein
VSEPARNRSPGSPRPKRRATSQPGTRRGRGAEREGGTERGAGAKHTRRASSADAARGAEQPAAVQYRDTLCRVFAWENTEADWAAGPPKPGTCLGWPGLSSVTVYRGWGFLESDGGGEVDDGG